MTTRRGRADLERRLAYAEEIEVIETMSREKVKLAGFIDQHSELDSDQAWDIIQMMCEEILPGYRGVEKLTVFRDKIRDHLKKPILEKLAGEQA